MKNWSFQLYSASEYELAPTLAILSQEGYSQVEGYGSLYEDLEGLQSLLVQNNLTMPTGHFDLAMLRDDMPRALEIAKTLEMHTIICPWLAKEDRPTDAQGWFDLGVQLEGFREQVIAEGFEMAWHNHEFELLAFEDGSFPIDHILAGGPNVKWEMDVAWVAKADQDPVVWIEKYSDRLIAAHLKDIAPEGECTDEGGWADLLHGTLAWRTYWQALSATGAKTFVMEHDNPNDIHRFASRAIASANTL